MRTFVKSLLVAIWSIFALSVTSVTFTSCSHNDNPVEKDVDLSVFFNQRVIDKINKDQALLNERGWGELIIERDDYRHAPELMLSDHARQVASILKKAGKTCFLVGGTVRDFINGTQPLDFDFTTDATNDELAVIFGSQWTPHLVGEELYGRVTIDGETLDVCAYSAIPYQYVGLPKMPTTAERSLLNDSYQRDLAFNAIYYDPFTKQLIDYHGGIRDLMNHVVNSIGFPELQYSFNCTSMLRTIRFAARYEFTLSERVDKALLEKAAEYAKNIPANVYTSNVSKCFNAGGAVRAGKMFTRYNLWSYISPSLDLTNDKQAGQKYMEDMMKIFDSTDWDKFTEDNDMYGFMYSSLLKYRTDELHASNPDIPADEIAEIIMKEHDKSAKFKPAVRAAIVAAIAAGIK